MHYRHFVCWYIYNDNSSDTMIVENNWWGDGKTYGSDSQEHAICDSVPISPPTDFRQTGGSGKNVDLAWTANPEGDLLGYKIYYGYSVDPPYSKYVRDVGNVTKYTLTLPEEGTYYITITACDRSADGENDLFEGHESWYAKGISVTTSP